MMSVAVIGTPNLPLFSIRCMVMLNIILLIHFTLSVGDYFLDFSLLVLLSCLRIEECLRYSELLWYV